MFFRISSSEDGDVYLSSFATKAELLADLPSYKVDVITSIHENISLCEWLGNSEILIEGKLLDLVPKEVITAYDLKPV